MPSVSVAAGTLEARTVLSSVVALALLALLYLRVLDGLLIKAMDLVFKAYYILLAPLTILLS